MITTNLSKGVLLFLMIVISMAVNLDDNLIARFGLSMNYGLVFLAALAIALLAADQKLPVILVIGIFSLIANMPDSFILNFGLDRDIFFGLMASLVLAPLFAWFLDI